MKSATLVLNSKITLITEQNGQSTIDTKNMSELASLISSVQILAFKGMAKPLKMEKYRDLITKLGFKETEIEFLRSAGFEGKNSDVLDFHIIYHR